MNEENEGSQVQEQVAETEAAPMTSVATEVVAEQTAEQTAEQAQATSKGKAKEEVDLLFVVAQEVGQLKKQQAWALAKKLIATEGENDYRLGAVLHAIKEGGWFDNHANFDQFVAAKFDFQPRKARYLVSIFEHLAKKSIPWAQVKDLGWSKLKELAPVLTLDNLDEWVAKAKPLTVVELQAVLKGATAAAPSTVNPTANVYKMNFKLDEQGLEIVSQGLSKAKGELNTEHDSAALVNVMGGYLGGTITAGGAPVASVEALQAMMAALGWEQTLIAFDKQFPEVGLEVTPPEDPALAAVAAAVSESAPE